MKLTTDTITQLDKLISTAMVGGLKKMVIEAGKIRGVDEKQTVVLISANGVPDLTGKQMGITRIDQLYARMNLVKSAGQLAVDTTDATANATDIAQLDLSSGKTKAQFRCASVEAVKGVPKTITDTLVWDIKVSSKILPMLTQGISAMGSETVTIASKDGKVVTFEAIDAGKDVFATEIDLPPVWIGVDDAGNPTPPATAFCEKYPAKTLLALMKEASKTNDPVTLQMGEGGILSLNVSGFDFYVIPTT